MKKIVSVLQDVTSYIPRKVAVFGAIGIAQAQTAVAQTADITGALETNQQGLTAVADSSFTGEGVKDASQNTLNAVLYAVGAVGVMMVVAGIWNLYNHFKEGDQARGNASTGILMIVIGGLMTIPAIITAVAPNLFLG